MVTSDYDKMPYAMMLEDMIDNCNAVYHETPLSVGKIVKPRKNTDSSILARKGRSELEKCEGEIK